MSTPIKDMTGMRFDRILVLARAPSDKNGNARWECQCGCGNKIITHGFNLRNGQTKSCGCLTTDQLIKRNTTHRGSKTVEYKIWHAMHRRCSAKATGKTRRLYYEKGIRVCERWGTFAHFLADMGPRPSPRHSLERLDGDAGYGPGNVEWALPIVQANNTTRNRFVVYRGQEMTVAEARRAAGSVISYAVAASRLKKGWTAEEAFETPPDPSVRNQFNPPEVANDAQIAITIPRAVRDKISALATQNGTTPSGYVRDVILRHLNLAEALP